MVTGMGRVEGSGKKSSVATWDTNWIAGRSGLARGCFLGRCSGWSGSSWFWVVSVVGLGLGGSGGPEVAVT